MLALYTDYFSQSKLTFKPKSTEHSSFSQTLASTAVFWRERLSYVGSKGSFLSKTFKTRFCSLFLAPNLALPYGNLKSFHNLGLLVREHLWPRDKGALLSSLREAASGQPRTSPASLNHSFVISSPSWKFQSPHPSPPPRIEQRAVKHQNRKATGGQGPREKAKKPGCAQWTRSQMLSLLDPEKNAT